MHEIVFYSLRVRVCTQPTKAVLFLSRLRALERFATACLPPEHFSHIIVRFSSNIRRGIYEWDFML